VETVPTADGPDFVLAYVGALPTASADQVKRYPELRDYPLLEVARLGTLADGTPFAPLVVIAPGAYGFGPYRVEATIEQPAPNVTVLRFASRPAPGLYALAFTFGPTVYFVAAR
jgi:hypothetical protein